MFRGWLGLWLLVLIAAPETLAACPFCTALRPTLAQQRESAQIVALAEPLAGDQSKQAGDAARFRLHQVFKGKERVAGAAQLSVETEQKLAPGSLALLFGEGDEKSPPAELEWSLFAVNETVLAYFARAPSLRTPTPERLRYFVKYLEHADPLVAEDALFEFGHAPYDALVQMADALPADRLREWLANPNIPGQRKGFYGLALALSGSGAQREENRDFLQRLVVEPADDFRAGFDGILGGYLVVAGEKGLALIEERILANPKSADGDVRHATSALRFYHEFGRDIPAARLCQAMRHLLARPEFAAAAIVDLARWQDWEALPQIAALYEVKAPSATRRAVVGYLLASPQPAARAELARLRQLDPAGVPELERALSRAGLRGTEDQ
jgi:hypothetical protein